MENESKRFFSKKHTLITKGILVIILLMHHVFRPPVEVTINTVIKDYELFLNIIIWGKICIAGFAFLTAYGMREEKLWQKEIAVADQQEGAGVEAAPYYGQAGRRNLEPAREGWRLLLDMRG